MQKPQKFPVIETTAPCTSTTIPVSNEIHKLTLDLDDDTKRKPKFRRIYKTWPILRFLNQLFNPQSDRISYVDNPMDEILPNLYLGGIRAATDRELLK
uniref:DUF4372 domain-containing protein n=2 Tax=Bursaphelenchus xylophilus TaxID=6326 RepID=A0A1I7SJS3_BURXY